MRRISSALLAAGMGTLLAAAPVRVQAQNEFIPAALAGGVVGAASGGYIAITVIVAESRTGKYMHSYADALGWRSAPVLIGGATGVVLGATSPDRLLRTVIYGGAGTLLGTGIGIVIGKRAWDGPEAKWAGGAIGAGIGMAIGSTLGVFLPMKSDGESAPSNQVTPGFPLSFTIRF
jgi:hypothetical protein